MNIYLGSAKEENMVEYEKNKTLIDKLRDIAPYDSGSLPLLAVLAVLAIVTAKKLIK